MEEDERRGERGSPSSARRFRANDIAPGRCAARLPRARNVEPGRSTTRIGSEIGDGSPVTPEMKLAQIVGTHDPDKSHASRSPLQPSDRVPGVTRTDFGLEAGDRDPGISGESLRGFEPRVHLGPGPPRISRDCRESRATTGGPAAGGATRVRRSGDVPSCGGLKEPPSSPIACPRAKRGRRTKAADDGPGRRNGARAAALSRSLGDIFEYPPRCDPPPAL